MPQKDGFIAGRNVKILYTNERTENKKTRISSPQKIGYKLNGQKLIQNIRPSMFIMLMKLGYFIVPSLSLLIYSKMKLKKL